jgi:hypothetical protein
MTADKDKAYQYHTTNVTGRQFSLLFILSRARERERETYRQKNKEMERDRDREKRENNIRVQVPWQQQTSELGFPPNSSGQFELDHAEIFFLLLKSLNKN